MCLLDTEVFDFLLQVEKYELIRHRLTREIKRAKKALKVSWTTTQAVRQNKLYVNPILRYSTEKVVTYVLEIGDLWSATPIEVLRQYPKAILTPQVLQPQHDRSHQAERASILRHCDNHSP
jgi:hypothetical protein